MTIHCPTCDLADRHLPLNSQRWTTSHFLSKEETFPLWVSLVLVTTLVLITICWRGKNSTSTWTALVRQVKGDTLRSLIDGEWGWSCRIESKRFIVWECACYMLSILVQGRRMWMNSEDRSHWDSDQSHEGYNCDRKLSSALTKAEKLENLHTASGALPVAQS